MPLSTPARRSLNRRPGAEWRQEQLLEEPPSTSLDADLPPPRFHQRLATRVEATATSRQRDRTLRSLAQTLGAGVVVVGAIVLVARLLLAVEPAPPDDGAVWNLLQAPSDAVAVSSAVAPTPAPAFVPSPFMQPAQAPAVSAQAAILVDLNDRTIVFSRSPHARRQPASISKLATAIVALREGRQTDLRIQVPATAAQPPPNVVGLQPGEVLNLQDLLFAMLLPSGNDAAATIADGIGGEAYTVAQMNDLARGLGLVDTQFANPQGYDAPGQYSTAYDLAVLATEALERYPVITRIVSTQTYVIPAGLANRSYAVTNLNGLLWTYPGAVGVKTGRTEEAGETIVAAAQRAGRRLLVVVMGSSNRVDDAIKLLDYGFAAISAQG
ncbi:MAG: D-alanyl-D-alanine carboxypeptidase [Actinobacteria bacterium]|nr:D-alanyl-D-alanine carboxypeptidase [Actinomycetota bacterium]